MHIGGFSLYGRALLKIQLSGGMVLITVYSVLKGQGGFICSKGPSVLCGSHADKEAAPASSPMEAEHTHEAFKTSIKNYFGNQPNCIDFLWGGSMYLSTSLLQRLKINASKYI